MFSDDCMFVWLGKQQLLAVGDGMGTLHVMEVPWNLRHPSANEVIVSHFRPRIYSEECVFK